MECLAVKVKCGQSTLVYTADGAYTPKLAEFAEGADLLIAECSLYAGADGARAGHMTSTDVAQLGCKAAPGMLLLSHLPLYGDPHLLVAQVKAQWNGEVRLAQTLMTVELPALKREESVP